MPSQSLYIPKRIDEYWYYAEDSAGKPYMINFINQCKSSNCCKNSGGIAIPPEKHDFYGTCISIEVDDETPNAYLRVLDRYSCLCLDITEIKNKFIEQENSKMDNNVNNDAVAARRRALAEALRTGEPVVVTASGEVEKKDDATDQGLSGIQVPDGKLA